VTWVGLAKAVVPKLTWALSALARAGIPCRLNGESFQSPTLEVPSGDVDRARRVFDPIAGLADNDSMFLDLDSAKAWWVRPPRPGDVAALAGGIGLAANRVRRVIADGASCLVPGASKFDCPYATGVIESCPANLWAVCRPMARLENHLIAVGTTMGVDDDAALARCAELLAAIEGLGAEDQTGATLSFFHILSLRMTEGRLSRLVKLAKKSSPEIVDDVMREVVSCKGSVIPTRGETPAEA